MEQVLDTIRDQGIRLEMNPHWMNITGSEDYDKMVWPQSWVVDMALQKGLKFSYGSDSHDARNVGSHLDKLRVHPIFGKALADWEAD